MTTAINNQVYDGGVSLPYPIKTDGTADINQGDYVYYDTSAKVVKSIGSNANAATAAGVAEDTSYSNLYGTKKYLPALQVITRGRFTFNTTNGDTYNHGDAVYIGADAQTITNTDPGGGNVIGYVWFTLGQAATAGGTGVTIQVLIAPKFPAVGVN